jgi:hypothetical protein
MTAEEFFDKNLYGESNVCFGCRYYERAYEFEGVGGICHHPDLDDEEIGVRIPGNPLCSNCEKYEVN